MAKDSRSSRSCGGLRRRQDHGKRPAQETCKYGERRFPKETYICGKRPTYVERDLHKRPANMGKTDLQKRPTNVERETDKRDLHTWQKTHE